MPSVLSSGRVPIKLWAPLESIEPAAITQLTNLSNLPCVFKQVAVMPDVHVGKGATVGSVIATKGAVIPAAVGVDIGCGMMAVKTQFTASQLPDSLGPLRSKIEAVVPVGHHEHPTALASAQTWDGQKGFDSIPSRLQDKRTKMLRQLGTLGGGNHFIEVCLDTDQGVWVVLHSGSRHIGKAIAEVHMDRAKALMESYFIALTDPDLAYLAEGTQEFQD
jgi:tRNA-splicing ligase RtcB